MNVIHRMYKGSITHRNDRVTYDNVNTNHPLINNAQDYVVYLKYVSISSDDRDVTKYPQSSTFEIELPEDIINVYKMSLDSWNFPSNYNTFSAQTSNITMYFQITKPYNPNEAGLCDLLQEAIFEALFTNINNYYTVVIEQGFYNPTQMTTELTNRFNQSVTDYIVTYFENHGYEDLVPAFAQSCGYREFIMVYNNVGQKIWFGNRSSGFTLNNSIISNQSTIFNPFGNCTSINPAGASLPNYSNWGLPYNLGFIRCDAPATASASINETRFYYGDVFPGDSGYWLLPNPSLPGAQTYYLEPVYKINLMGPAYFYMDINGYNCLDVTSPYNLSKFTLETNQTNSIVNGAFAKINVLSTPVSQFYERNSNCYKLFYPVAERIRRLSIKFRYPDGSPVDFGTFTFNFTIQFQILVPQINRAVNRVDYTLV